MEENIGLEVQEKKESKPTEVIVKVSITSVNGVNTVEECFECSFYMDWTWANPSIKDAELKKMIGIPKPNLLDYVKMLKTEGSIDSLEEFKEIEDSKVWNPSINFSNARSMEDIPGNFQNVLVVRWKDGTPTVTKKIK